MMRTAVYQTSPTHLASDVTSQRCVTPAVLGTPDNVSLSKVTILDLSPIMSGTPDNIESILTDHFTWEASADFSAQYLNVLGPSVCLYDTLSSLPHCLTAHSTAHNTQSKLCPGRATLPRCLACPHRHNRFCAG